jgi:hypothetical protein
MQDEPSVTDDVSPVKAQTTVVDRIGRVIAVIDSLWSPAVGAEVRLADGSTAVVSQVSVSLEAERLVSRVKLDIGAGVVSAETFEQNRAKLSDDAAGGDA